MLFYELNKKKVWAKKGKNNNVSKFEVIISLIKSNMSYRDLKKITVLKFDLGKLL